MAKFNYDEYKKRMNSKETTDSKFKVGFFSLKDDGDLAIVRFNYADGSEIETVTTHRVKVTNRDGKEIYRQVACLRTPYEPIENCPLCLADNKQLLKIYVPLVEYVTDAHGQVTVKAKIWERPASFADELKPLIAEYGDLRDIIFKVVRVGARNDMKTTYKILPVRADLYSPTVYVKDFSDFDDFNAAGSSYLVKKATEMRAYLATGDFFSAEANPVTEEKRVVETDNQPDGSYVRVNTGVETHKTEQQPQNNPTEGRPQRFTF